MHDNVNMLLGLFALPMLFEWCYGCFQVPNCPVAWSHPNAICRNSEYLLKRTMASMDRTVSSFNVTHFAENLSVKACTPGAYSSLYKCIAEVANVDVKWVG